MQVKNLIAYLSELDPEEEGIASIWQRSDLDEQTQQDFFTPAAWKFLADNVTIQYDEIIEMLWYWRQQNSDLIGECDKCEAIYDVSSRLGRCGNCGNCGVCCTHTTNETESN